MEPRVYLDGRVRLLPGDCREGLKSLADNSVDAFVTDPPYALVSIVKRFGGENAAPATPKEGAAGAYARASAGFMGKQWDTGETAFSAEFWAEVLRVLKPGGHVVAFSGTRTYHRMAVAIEDAGFEIRDQLAWAYATGFPKSHNVPKAIDRHLGAERPVIGQETIANDMRNSALIKDEAREAYQRNVTANGSPEAEAWEGWGTALKPAWEPIALARKPLAVPDGAGGWRPATVAENVLHWGVGAINIRATRIPAEKPTGWGGNAGGGNTWNEGNSGLGKDGEARPVDGRYPANIVHDGSPEVVGMFPETGITGDGVVKRASAAGYQGNAYGKESRPVGTVTPSHPDAGGSAARFFFSAKADHDDRLGSKHPTVKPLDLMRWLVRLVCPKGGTVVDPFAGTGPTGAAAFWEGCSAILCEREEEYQADIAKRMSLVLSGPDERKRARTKADPPEDLPLFGGDGTAKTGGLTRRIYGEFDHDKTGKRYDPASARADD